MNRPTTSRAILASATGLCILVAGVLTLVYGYSGTPLVKIVQFLAVLALGVIVIGGSVVLALVRLADWRTPEEDFERIVQRAERLGAYQRFSYEQLDDDDDERDEWQPDEDDYFDFSEEEDFRALVRSAVDELPLELHRELEHVAIVVADSGGTVRVGRGHRTVYGMFQGDTVAQDYFRDRILIFRDALVRDFGHDPEVLRGQVSEIVRRELSRHLGSNDKGLRGR